MLTASMKSVLIAGKATVLATILSSAAYAQISVDTPAGTNVTIPGAALEGQAPVATTADTGYELLAQGANDEVIVNSLISQGYSDVVITRDGTVLTVTADRDGTMLELVYSTATGRLISVDGVPVGPSESDFVVIDAPVDPASPAPVDTVGGGGSGVAAEPAPEPGLPGDTDGPAPDADDTDDQTDADADADAAEGAAETDADAEGVSETEAEG